MTTPRTPEGNLSAQELALRDEIITWLADESITVDVARGERVNTKAIDFHASVTFIRVQRIRDSKVGKITGNHSTGGVEYFHVAFDDGTFAIEDAANFQAL